MHILDVLWAFSEVPLVMENMETLGHFKNVFQSLEKS